MRLANIARLGVKELRGIGREPMLMILILYAFTVSIYTAAEAMPETLNNAPIAIVDEDRSQLSTRIVAAFYPPSFSPPSLISIQEMDARLDAGRDTFALDIPAGFQRDLLAGRDPAIQLNIDATRMSQAFTGGGYVQSIVSSEIETFLAGHREAAVPTADLALRARFNPTLDKGWFGALSELISGVTMLSTILAGAALIREREHGTIEHLLVMPVTTLEIMAAKIWSVGLVVLAAAALSLTLVVQGLLEVPVQGSVALFLTGTALHLFAAICLGIFLATVAGSMPQFGLMLMLVLLPLQVLSGGMTPRESMPEAIRNIMLLAPNTHYIMLSQGVLFRGAGLSVVWPQLVALAAIGAGLFWLSLHRFRRFLR